MNGYVFDFVGMFVVIAALMIGLRRGVARELVDLVAIIGGIVVVAIAGRMGLRRLMSIGGDETAGVIMTAFQFALGLVGMHLLGRMAERKMSRQGEMEGLGPVHRLAGAAVAVLKAAIGIGFILITLIRFPVLPTAWIAESIAAPVFIVFGRVFLYALPADFAEAVGAFFLQAT